MKNSKILLIAASLTVLIVSCSKKDLNSTTQPTPTPTPTVNKIAPDGFGYITTKTVTVNISALSNDDKVLSTIPMNIYYLNNDGTLSNIIYNGLTDDLGALSVAVTVPSNTDTLIIDPAYIGLIRLAKTPINGSSINCVFGGSKGYGGDIVGTMSTGSNLSSKPHSQSFNQVFGLVPFGYTNTNTTKFGYMGKYDVLGRPLYLEAQSDIISAAMLSAINTSLPETKNVAVTHPQYITDGAASNIVINQLADVYLTFTYEGAGYRNAMGWYKYKTGNPPKTIYDIDSIHFVFPNCSLVGSGGGMWSGDKVNIGRFDAGYTIGLVLFADGWNGTAVNYYAGGAYFTDANLNPEVNPSLKRHTVLLQYQDKYLIGFEDMNREGGSDNDFNDVIVYATSNPVNAISQNNVQVADAPLDTDGDGVIDSQDAFPTDPTRAYINYYPAQNTWGTLAYEDNWPLLGDYDMNDLIVSYQYKYISNAKNNVVEIYGKFAPIATGAVYNNGFGLQFPFATSLVKTVTGQILKNNYIKTNANGTEAGQTNAVIIPFDNARSLINYSDGGLFINTRMSLTKASGDTSNVYVQFTSPISLSTLGISSFNPFLISDMRRGYEVHLPNFAPTSLIDNTLFGTQNDASIPTSGIYYLTKDNHPWGLNFVSSFKYPTETISIDQSYLHFFDWAKSGGTLYKDWFSNTGAGYQNTSNIYTK